MKSPTRLPRLLLTNDDGLDAPGLTVLTELTRDFADEIWVIAPDTNQSGKAQSLSLLEPLRCTPEGERRWSISGTPADCIALALSHLMLDARPTILLSGINAGANTGDDVNMSGTLGAAFTGLMLGVPSIAISIDQTSRKKTRWDTARAVTPKLLHHFFQEGWRKETCLSINIPDLPADKITGFSWTRPAQKTIAGFRITNRTDLRENDYHWLYPVENDAPPKNHTDLAALARGEVSVSALTLDRSIEINEPSLMFDEPATVDE